MAVSDAQRQYRMTYGKGYNAGKRGSLPDHRPPVPPHEVIASLMTALRNLRDKADSACAMLDPEDEFVQKLGPGIDEADAALSAVSRWLKTEC